MGLYDYYRFTGRNFEGFRAISSDQIPAWVTKKLACRGPKTKEIKLKKMYQIRLIWV